MKIFEIITEAPKHDNAFVQQVKDLWDSGITSPTKIAAKLGSSKKQIEALLYKYFPDRLGKQEKEKWTPELIQQVKDLWDSGITSPTKIAAKLGTSKGQINDILYQHYRNRPGKAENYTSELIQQVKDLWDSGMRSSTQMASELGTDSNKIKDILKKYYLDRPGKLKQESLPQELLTSIISMYKNGQSVTSILDTLKLNVSRSGVNGALRRLPNWDEIRAEHLANKPTRKKSAATTDIHRPGTIGNKRSKGPGSRHTAGVDWPKYG